MTPPSGSTPPLDSHGPGTVPPEPHGEAGVYLFLGDETNRTQSQRSRFFLYGALFVPLETVDELDERIAEIRRDVPLRETDALKFDTRSRPEDVSIDAYTAAKSAVIDACVETGVQFAAYAILHDIAKGRPDDLLPYALNSLLYVFDSKYLNEKISSGLCVVDRFDGEHDILREKHQRGVYVEEKDEWVSLPRIKLYGATCDGASHLSSAVDIVLGAFRYCVNEVEKTEVPRQLLPRVAYMMYHRKIAGVRHLRDHGLVLRPQAVRVDTYREEYEALVERLAKLMEQAEAEQAAGEAPTPPGGEVT